MSNSVDARNANELSSLVISDSCGNLKGVHASASESTPAVPWLLLVLLFGIHLVLQIAVHVALGILSPPWPPLLHTFNGSLNGTQYILLAGLWAISRCAWQTRTIWAFAGFMLLTVTHVAGGLLVWRRQGPLLEEIALYFDNCLQVFLGEFLVVAISVELLRPFLGVLTRTQLMRPERSSIFTLMRITALSAATVIILRFYGEISSEIFESMELTKTWFFSASLLLSCMWLLFAERRNWIGLVAANAVIVLDVMFSHPNLLGNGYVTLMSRKWIDMACICLTFLPIRAAGYRLTKYRASRRADQGPAIHSESMCAG